MLVTAIQKRIGPVSFPGSVRCLVAGSRVIKNKEDKFNEYESQGINVRLRPRYMRCVVLPRDGG
jgi:hypothetical protein